MDWYYSGVEDIREVVGEDPERTRDDRRYS